eukprot:CAMPEP_0196676660 /NCGR_PEP_ID=MMETSP1090-20130531/5080_1 /TAXON_ID=37098 /ORGANISM="Isochrysis sp, Strain CCMP1244" /LENGTH=345 /DNA_ID=CAMNT_0042014675 /DNA_START=54 /DNA_END=1091 /DNA_ORIENTATION=+
MAHLCSLRAKLAKYKRELVADPKGGGGGPGEGFDVRATGDARVGFVGFPSVGKSTLLTSLTDVASEAASYEFTTLTCIPGIKYWKGAKIQLLDLPGIIEGARDGKGRGRQVIAVARTCSCLIIVLDAMKDIAQKKIIERELEGVGIRLNKQPPDIRVEKKVSGGINFAATCKLTHLDEDSIKAILTEYRIMSATVRINCDATPDDLIDAIEGNRVYMPCVYALNKIDAITMEELDILDQIPHYCPISSHYQWNLDGLMDMVFEYLSMTRVYTKPKGQMPDYEAPVIIRGSQKPTVEVFCKKIHRQLIHDFKYGWVWGSSVKFNPQKVGKAHLLHDEDVLQIVKKI